MTTSQEISPQLRYAQWRNMVIDWVRSDRPDLSNRQLAVLLTVTADPAPHTVRGLANYLNIAKPAVSRALDRLEELEYLKRVPDRRDGRNVFIVATRVGETIVEDLAEDLKSC